MIVDHAAEAAECMKQAEERNFTDRSVPRLIEAAQVHATLALALELRASTALHRTMMAGIPRR